MIRLSVPLSVHNQTNPLLVPCFAFRIGSPASFDWSVEQRCPQKRLKYPNFSSITVTLGLFSLVGLVLTEAEEVWK